MSSISAMVIWVSSTSKRSICASETSRSSPSTKPCSMACLTPPTRFWCAAGSMTRSPFRAQPKAENALSMVRRTRSTPLTTARRSWWTMTSIPSSESGACLPGGRTPHNKKLPTKGHEMGQWNGPGRWAARVAVCLVLSGCMAPGGTGDDETVSRFGAISAGGGIGSEATDESRSAVISALQGRQSILPPGSGYDQVAGAVLAANSRTAEAELRAARLRAEAASKNWLPKIGPNISLTSLSEVVATIFVEQVLFDHGRLRAERLFAKADVEV